MAAIDVEDRSAPPRVAYREEFDAIYGRLFEAATEQARRAGVEPSFMMLICGGCHPGAAVYASYDRDGGVILMLCAVCHEAVAQVAVARAADR